MSVLEIENLYVRYQQETLVNAVHNVSFRLEPGESLGIIGESGSGKSTLAMSIMGLLDARVHSRGNIRFNGKELCNLSDKERDTYRWSRIAIAFQNSLDVLNPVMRVGDQITECIIKHTEMKKKEAVAKTEQLFEMVGLEPNWYSAYPHHLSGGMRQKMLIAMALSCNPDVLIVDEPTMALDAVAKQKIIQLLIHLKEEKGFSLLVISHELPIIAALSSRVMVMYSGNILEEGKTKDILRDPLHPYTKGLIYSSPSIHPYQDMWGIPGEIHITEKNQCPFYSRCNQRIDECLRQNPGLEGAPGKRRIACLRGGIVTLLAASKLQKTYYTKKREVVACSDCKIEIKSSEVVALIGQSGSGKTTLASMLSGIVPPDRGEIIFEGRKISGNSETAKLQGIQIVFQDPLSATNENLTIGEIVQEPLDIIKKDTKADRLLQVRTALEQVQLPYDDEFLKRRGHMLSGGQRQRIAIARALVMAPKLMIADEISSMLDPSSAANLLRLLKGLQNDRGFSMLYITHDIALARKIADKAYVMYKGKIIEYGTASKVLYQPKEPYTKMLLQGTMIENE